MLTDLTEPELEAYRSSQSRPAGFADFWSGTLAEARSHELRVQATPVDTGLRTLDVHDVTFPGFAGDEIRAWLTVPRGTTDRLPVVVELVGYGGGRGRPWENLFWGSAGFAHLVMDTRGQGSVWSAGSTADPHGSSGPQGPGVMTRGIESPETYYYRRLITDAVRCVDAVAALPHVDPERVAVLGASQGGGLAIAVAALVPDVRALVAMTPFLCDVPRAIRVTDAHPYREVADYLAVHRDRVDRVMATLAHVDGVGFARLAHQPAWFSAALMDEVTPPSTVFGAYHAYAGPKQMTVWPFNGHESGGPDEQALVLAFLRDVLRTP